MTRFATRKTTTMAEQYEVHETDPTMVKEDTTPYAQGVTIPVDLPTTGGYSVEYLHFNS